MSKKFYFSCKYLIFTILFFSLGSIQAFAADDLNVKVEPEYNKIHLTWNNVSSEYKLSLIEEGIEKSLYEGDEHEFVVTNLEEGKIYRFKLSTIKNNKEVDSVIINTSTTDNNKGIQSFTATNDETYEIKNHMKDARINIFIGNEKITVEWDNIPNDFDYYEVYKNDSLIKYVNELYFVDTDIVKDEIYRYEIVGHKKLSKDKIDEVNNELRKNGIKPDLKNSKDLYYERKSLSAIVRASEENVLPKVEEQIKNVANTTATRDLLHQDSNFNTLASFTPPPGYGYMLRYTTFIPMDYAPNPFCNVVCVYKYYGGDDRGFVMWSNKFRTRSDVYLTWNGSSKYAKLDPQIGRTTGYDANYNLIGSGTAPTSDIKIYNIEFGNDYIYHRMGLASSNPLNIANPDIDAFYYAKVYRDGRGEFYGVHDKAPSHEFYILVYPGDFYAPIHRATHKGFDNLLPHTPKEEFQVNLY